MSGLDITSKAGGGRKVEGVGGGRKVGPADLLSSGEIIQLAVLIDRRAVKRCADGQVRCAQDVHLMSRCSARPMERTQKRSETENIL